MLGVRLTKYQQTHSDIQPATQQMFTCLFTYWLEPILYLQQLPLWTDLLSSCIYTFNRNIQDYHIACSLGISEVKEKLNSTIWSASKSLANWNVSVSLKVRLCRHLVILATDLQCLHVFNILSHTTVCGVSQQGMWCSVTQYMSRMCAWLPC